MDKSIWELVNILICRRFKCVRDYQGNSTREAATIEHVSTPSYIGVACSFVGLFSYYPLYAFPLFLLYYTLIKEIVIDGWIKKKNYIGGKMFWPNVWAQCIERTGGVIPWMIFYVPAWFL